MLSDPTPQTLTAEVGLQRCALAFGRVRPKAVDGCNRRELLQVTWPI
jgi:hypothetical protein